MNTNQKDKTMPSYEMTQELKAAGAEIAKREDRHGETKSGWWLDGVYLAPASRPQDAQLAALREAAEVLADVSEQVIDAENRSMPKLFPLLSDLVQALIRYRQVAAALSPAPQAGGAK